MDSTQFSPALHACPSDMKVTTYYDDEYMLHVTCLSMPWKQAKCSWGSTCSLHDTATTLYWVLDEAMTHHVLQHIATKSHPLYFPARRHLKM